MSKYFQVITVLLFCRSEKNLTTDYWKKATDTCQSLVLLSCGCFLLNITLSLTPQVTFRLEFEFSHSVLLDHVRLILEVTR